MGRMQREKGKSFERAIAAKLRERWPLALVRRASQAERADNPDVFVEGGPPVLERLWLELQDARQPTPAAKLAQAERDASAWFARRAGPMDPDDYRTENHRLPVVVWHRFAERTINVSTRLWVIYELAGVKAMHGSPLVTLDLETFLPMLEPRSA